MSRYVIPTEPGRNREVIVGWDPPMGTFFGQVYQVDVPDDEEELLEWIGNQPREVKTLMEIVEWANQAGFPIPDVIQRNLVLDQEQFWEPGPLQKAFGFTGKEDA